jgi:hypothetical protein
MTGMRWVHELSRRRSLSGKNSMDGLRWVDDAVFLPQLAHETDRGGAFDSELS